MQGFNRIFPISPEHHVIEVWNDVVDRAATVAKRRATVHATCRLVAGLRVVKANDELFVVFQALGNGFVAFFNALVFHEASDFSHNDVQLISLSF